MEEGILSIEEAFGTLSDPRSRTPVHNLTEILMVALCAILSGADSWLGIQYWGEAKLDWLRRYLPLANGIPSHDTFGRVFAALDPEQFEACFIRWTGHLCPALAEQIVAIDGKTVRRSHRGDRRAIHLVSAYAAGLGVVLGQVRTADKSNEITAIPALLDALQLKGAIVTIDAMGCQRDIARHIVATGADYVLALKGNQPRLLKEIRHALTLTQANPQQLTDLFPNSEYCDVGKGHGRIETRRCFAMAWHPLTPFEPEIWPGLKSIAVVESTCMAGDRVTTQQRYYLSSLVPDAARIAQAVRSHWEIESMHWVMDVTFQEDQCRARVEHAAQNFAVLRRIATNLIKRDTSTKAGVRIRRLKAGASDDYRAQLLGLQPLQDPM